MRKSSVVLIVVIVVVLIGVAVAVGQKTNTTTTPRIPDNSQPNSNDSKAPSESAAVPVPGAVTIKNMMFTPSQISVKKGATVTWTNEDGTAHTVTNDLVGKGPASGTIVPGATYSYTFTRTGSFQYHCEIHHSMRGTIVVK